MQYNESFICTLTCCQSLTASLHKGDALYVQEYPFLFTSVWFVSGLFSLVCNLSHFTALGFWDRVTFRFVLDWWHMTVSHFWCLHIRWQFRLLFLLGESVPVTKTPLPQQKKDEVFNVRSTARHVLFGGTSVIQTRNYADERVLAMVIRTGFRTAKGELVRSILFPKPLTFKFTQDALKFVGALAVLAFVGFGISVYFMVRV